jgi:tetratricopeptide (TPR) repeat protein
MSAGPTLCIRQSPANGEHYPIRLTLKRPGQPDIEAEARVAFALSAQEQADLRWYMEDYLHVADTVETIQVEQIEAMLQARGEELYQQVLTANRDTQAIWFAIREQLAELRVEISSGIVEAAAIPWELMRDPASDSAIAVRVQAFVRVQSNPNIGFVPVPPPAEDGRTRLLYVVCRPNGSHDVALRAVANRLLQGLEQHGGRERFEITALRPPTYEQLQKNLTDAKAAGRPFHIVHFDGHGVYADLSHSRLADWLSAFSSLMLGGKPQGKHGYLLFEHPDGADNARPVPGAELGKLLHDCGVPVLVLNACQSAMHQAWEQEAGEATRAIGSLAQAVVDQGIPAVLGMRYSVFVVTAAQYIGELYAALAKGRGFGQAASEARKHLQRNPERWLGLQPRALQDWLVPVVFEAMPLDLPRPAAPSSLPPRLDPVQRDEALLRRVPDQGFIGRDETLLLLERAFDSRRVVLLHAYAGQGKTSTAVEFARWYTQTSAREAEPLVLFTSFESHTDLADVLNQAGRLLQDQGVDWLAVNEPAQRRNGVLHWLRQVPVLWLWDNVEPIAGFPDGTDSAWTPAEQRELADFLKQIGLDPSSKAKLLLTSRRDERRWLGNIPRRVAMRPMLNSDAAALALALGRERGLKPGDIAAWQPLLDYCAGNPLTLRVIAGQAIAQGLRSRERIAAFIQAVRDGEAHIVDADAAEGRERSLGASLDYGFRHAFQPDELAVLALLHCFQGVVDVNALRWMGLGQHALAELQGWDKNRLNGLLQRAAAIGLLRPLGATWYGIHPALPWFLRQMFARHYDGLAGRSNSEAVLRAWVAAIGALGNYYHDQFGDGNREVIRYLRLEEANLLHARRLARRHGWWDAVIYPMQGLRELYDYQGRGAEWARLVGEIVPDYCTADDAPMAGREVQYSLVMGYRVDLARQQRDLAGAAALQDKRVAWDRSQAAAALALPADAVLDDGQRNRIRTLGVSVFALGQILREQGSGDCVAAYEDAICHYRRSGDRATEAIAWYNLGHAYQDIAAIRDLDAAAAAYQCSLELRDPRDALWRAKCQQAIGIVHYQRFNEARRRDEPEAILLAHAQAAQAHYLQALALCPADAIVDLGPLHNQLGILYKNVGQTERAREHYEPAAHCFEQSGDRYNAGQTRYNLALMYAQAGERESSATRRRELWQRARAYAEAALRDFRHYQGRAAADEAKAQQLIDHIEQALAGLGAG